MKTIDRYPGAAPFRKFQKHLFKGRDEDIARLYDLINSRQQLLLYSQSGLGKSSLVNAGLLPKLDKRADKQYITIRFWAYQENGPTPLETMVDAIKQWAVVHDYPDKILPGANSLWYHLKKRQQPGKEFLFIFDQFEELFTYPDEAIFAFKKQLSELFYTLIPEGFRIVLKKMQQEENPILSQEEYNWLQTGLLVKGLYIIRSDYLSKLDTLTDHLPDVLSKRMELKPLNVEQTKQAILEPAAQKGEHASPAFSYRPEAFDKIINFLTQDGKKEVETTQLQLICSKLEAVASDKNARGQTDIWIELDDIPDFTDLFLQFYEDAIARLPGHRQKQAKAFIEDTLIRKETRVSLDLLVAADYLSKQDIDVLIRSHLLRSEPNSTGGESLELSHDTLIGPVLEARKARQEELKIEQQKREANRRLRRYFKISVYILSFLLLLSISLFSYFLFQKNEKLADLNEQINTAYVELSQIINIERDTITGKRPSIKFLVRETKQNTVDLSDELEQFNALAQKLDTAEAISKEDVINIASEYNEVVKSMRENNMMATVEEVKDSLRKDPDRKAKDSLAWQRVTRRSTVNAYRQYLDQFDFGRYRKEAQKRMKKLQEDNFWEKTRGKNTIKAYQEYLNSYPDGKYVKEAQTQIKFLRQEKDNSAFRKAKETNTIKAFTEYLEKWKNGAHKEEAKQEIAFLEEQKAWEKAQKENTIVSYKQYLSTYRNAKHSAQARKKITKLETAAAWKTAQNQNTCQSYQQFIDQYPESQYATQAQKQRESLNCGEDFPTPEMVEIPGGTFQMGSDDPDTDNEPHTVTVSGFYMGKYEVTQEQYEAIMGDNPSDFDDKPNHPVENVNWYDAVEYCNRLSLKSGKTPCYSYEGQGTDPDDWPSGWKDETHNKISCDFWANGFRLPTEAEWEYAAGGGENNRTKYAGTDNENELEDYAWYTNNNNSQTHPVGKKESNAFGLYDMSGNVYEWCNSWYVAYGEKYQTRAENCSDCSLRVHRGGCWNDSAARCRVAYRNRNAPGHRYYYLGFRLVLRP